MLKERGCLGNIALGDFPAAQICRVEARVIESVALAKTIILCSKELEAALTILERQLVLAESVINQASVEQC